MLSVEARPDGFLATLALDAGFVLLPDHFPGSPILPGMCMLQAVLLAAAEQQRTGDLRLVALKNAKLMRPVAPGETVDIDAFVDLQPDGNVVIKAKLSVDGKRTAEFSLIARPVMVDSPAAV